MIKYDDSTDRQTWLEPPYSTNAGSFLEISEILHRIAAQNTTVAPMGLVEKAWMDVKHLIMKNTSPHCHPRLERGTRKSFVSGSQLSSSGFPHSRE